jgi:2-succinyl-6-hydroxy-2,4-cyclohexadiene-1-carboxylate synthase
VGRGRAGTPAIAEQLNFASPSGDGVVYHASRAGDGPPLVLLHGFTGSTRTWDGLIASITRSFTTIAVDLVGHGETTAPADPRVYAHDRIARDLSALLDHLHIERTAVLGYSMGGRAALRFALANPDRVAALILESTSPGLADPADRESRIESDNALADSIERGGVAGLAEFVDRWERLPLWNRQAALSEAAKRELRAQRLRNDPLGLANSLRGAGTGTEPDVTDRLSSFRTDVLLIAGEHDARYAALGREMLEAFPAATLEIVAGASHMVHLDRPLEFATLVDRFLEDVQQRSGAWR